MPTIVIVLWCLLVHGSHTPVSYVYVCTKSDLLKACIEPHPSIDCCCRPEECYPSSMSASHGITVVHSKCIRPLQSNFHLFEACPGVCKLAGATYSTVHHTYWSIDIPISCHGYMHSYVYIPTSYNTLTAQILMYASVLAIQVKSRSDPDCYLGYRVSSCDPVLMLVCKC